MDEYVSIGVVVAKAFAAVAGALIKGTMGEAAKDAYRALKSRISRHASSEIQTLETAPSSEDSRGAVADATDGLPKHAKEAIVALTNDLLCKMVSQTSLGKSEHDYWSELHEELREANIRGRNKIQIQKGKNNIQAGRDVIFNSPRAAEGNLEIIKVGFTNHAEFDVMLRNTGDIDVLIHRISITNLVDDKISVTPILKPSARYKISVDGIKEGHSKAIDVSHLVKARSVDRLLIALNTTHCYLLEVEFTYDDGQQVGFTRRTWSGSEREDSEKNVEFSRWFRQELSRRLRKDEP